MKKIYKYINEKHIILKNQEDYDFMIGALKEKTKNFEKDPYIMKNLIQLKDMIDAMIVFLKRR